MQLQTSALWRPGAGGGVSWQGWEEGMEEEPEVSRAAAQRGEQPCEQRGSTQGTLWREERVPERKLKAVPVFKHPERLLYLVPKATWS